MVHNDALKMTDVTLMAIFIDGVEIPVENLEQAVRAIHRNRHMSDFIEHFIVQASGTPDRALLDIYWDSDDRSDSYVVLTPHSHSPADFGLPAFGTYQFSLEHCEY